MATRKERDWTAVPNHTGENPPETTKGRRAGPETTDLPDAGTGGTELLDTALTGDFLWLRLQRQRGQKQK